MTLQVARLRHGRPTGVGVNDLEIRISGPHGLVSWNVGYPTTHPYPTWLSTRPRWGDLTALNQVGVAVAEE